MNLFAEPNSWKQHKKVIAVLCNLEFFELSLSFSLYLIECFRKPTRFYKFHLFHITFVSTCVINYGTQIQNWSRHLIYHQLFPYNYQFVISWIVCIWNQAMYHWNFSPFKIIIIHRASYDAPSKSSKRSCLISWLQYFLTSQCQDARLPQENNFEWLLVRVHERKWIGKVVSNV